jgi:argininosuccinate lyase
VCGVDYRTAYLVVGIAVRQASQEGLRGIDLDGERLDRAAVEYRGKTLGLTGRDLTEILDPTHIVATRTVTGGAAPGLVEKMAEDCENKANSLMAGVRSRRESIQSAEKTLLAAAAALIEGES